MRIEPGPDIVYLKLERPETGVLDTSSRNAAIEYGEVLASGEGTYQAGDKVFVKSWAVDRVTHNGETYDFVNLKTGGILAKVYDL